MDTTAKQANRTTQHQCKRCNRIYLSYAALYLHTKNKHVLPNLSQIPLSSKDRGRPKKAHNDTENSASCKFFYSLPERTGITTEIVSTLEEANQILYYRKDHPFIKCMEFVVTHPFINIGVKCLDDVYAEYLVFAASLTNKQFYLTICKFILLLRDGYQNKIKDNLFCNVEELPCFVNELLSQKLVSLFGYDLGKGLCINFCQWLYNNAYTSIKLILKK